MDIFRFNNPTNPTKMEQGEIIDDLKTKLWVERYRDPGEFELTAYASTGIIKKLPIGSFVSHVDTSEIMIVEDHSVKEDKGKETVVSITGRSFETFLVNRIVGSNRDWSDNLLTPGYTLGALDTWDQAAFLISLHILPVWLYDDDDSLEFFEVIADVAGTGTAEERTVKLGDLYTRTLEILAVDDLGIKTVRPGPWSPAVTASSTCFVIHKGVDRSSYLVFSHDSGEIDSADYLWSNRKLKNSALVTSKWFSILIGSSEVGVNRRTMHVDASDIDNQYSEEPVVGDQPAIFAAMEARGNEALSNQNNVVLSNVQTSKGTKKAIFRKDYDVGDIITVSGDYNETAAMRVNEYAEIEDEDGMSGYPTLTAL